MMGAADAVPGVSGGTIAFITGIYEELIETIRRFDLEALTCLRRFGFSAFWQHINGSFLLALLCGIGVSLATFAHVVLFMLDTYPEVLWAFFFGLILASVWVVGRQITNRSLFTTLFFLLGALLAYLATSLSPAEIEVTPLSLFLAGAIAICAMILPGISGSFILLLLGMYSVILGAVKAADFSTLGLFLLGSVIGIISFSRVLNWLFHHYRNNTLALMAGFLLGSLNKVWPWKYTTAYTINRHGEQVPLVQEKVSPFSYEVLTGQDAFFSAAILVFIIGVVLVLWMERGSSGGVVDEQKQA